MHEPAPGTMPSSASGLHASCHDLEDARRWMANICGPHSLRSSAERPLAFEHRANRLGRGTTVLGRIQYGTDVVIGIDSASTLKSYSISLPLDGEQALQLGRCRVRSDRHSGVIVSPYAQQQLSIAADCRKLQVVIDCRALHQVLEQMLLSKPVAPLVFEPRIEGEQGSGADWWRLVRYVMAEMEADSLLLAQPTLAQDLERTLIKALLLAQPSNYSAALRQASDAHWPEFVRRARRFIEAQAQGDVRLADIESAAGVSAQRLHDGFKTCLGLSPVAYLKRHRLYGARRSLLEGQGRHNVAAIATQWGFAHLGRFAADYARLFGELPSHTLANMG